MNETRNDGNRSAFSRWSLLTFVCCLAVGGALSGPGSNLPGVASAQTPDVVPSNTVMLYQHQNFGGAKLEGFTDVEEYKDLTKIPMSGSTSWNDQVSSVKIGKDACLMAYRDINFKGSMTRYIGNGSSQRNEPVLPNSWNDRISSFKVKGRGNCQ
jgi:hypothetical protein